MLLHIDLLFKGSDLVFDYFRFNEGFYDKNILYSSHKRLHKSTLTKTDTDCKLRPTSGPDLTVYKNQIVFKGAVFRRKRITYIVQVSALLAAIVKGF